MERADSSPGARWRPAGFRDPRLLVGVVLVLASVLGVGWLLRSAQDTETVWSAAVDLPAGAELRSQDLVAVDVKLGRTSKRYLASTAVPDPGVRVLVPMSKGELIPVSGVGAADPNGRRPLSVRVEGPAPVGVKFGVFVDVYATPHATPGTQDAVSRMVLSSVEVTAVKQAEASAVGQASTDVDLLVPAEQVSDFIQARGAGERLDVVALPPGAKE